MKKFPTGLLFIALMLAAAAGFSGCGKKNGQLAATAQGKGGQSEPNVTFKDLQGNTVPLASLKGKVVLVNFWATWCEPCRAEIPWMIDFQKQFGDKGFTLLGVAMDDEGKKVVEPFVQQTQFDVDGHSATMNYPIVLGNDTIASQFGGLIGLPTSVLLSRDGKIEKRYIGLVNRDELAKEIQSLLGA